MKWSLQLFLTRNFGTREIFQCQNVYKILKDDVVHRNTRAMVRKILQRYLFLSLIRKRRFSNKLKNQKMITIWGLEHRSSPSPGASVVWQRWTGSGCIWTTIMILPLVAGGLARHPRWGGPGWGAAALGTHHPLVPPRPPQRLICPSTAPREQQAPTSQMADRLTGHTLTYTPSLA